MIEYLYIIITEFGDILHTKDLPVDYMSGGHDYLVRVANGCVPEYYCDEDEEWYELEQVPR